MYVMKRSLYTNQEHGKLSCIDLTVCWRQSTTFEHAIFMGGEHIRLMEYLIYHSHFIWNSGWSFCKLDIRRVDELSNDSKRYIYVLKQVTVQMACCFIYKYICLIERKPMAAHGGAAWND